MSAPWWEGLAPVSASVQGHEIRWEAGELKLLAHPDAEGEAALAALGGERCPCLDLAAAWRAQHERPTILALAPRHADDRIGLDPAVVDRLQAEAQRWRNQWAAAATDLRAAGDAAGVARLREIAAPAERALAVRVGLLRLLSLGPDVVDRLLRSLQARQ